MSDLEKKIKKLSDDILESKTRQKRIKSFAKYLNEWNILRLTPQRRKELDIFFKRYELQLIKPYTNEVIDVFDISREDNVVIKYCDFHQSPTKEIKASNPNNIIVKIANGTSPKKPYPFQVKAYKELNTFYSVNNKKGLLILPTGAGKTFTAVSWILRNIVNENIKLIWITHRHELLEQVAREIQNLSYSNILPQKNSFSIHLISGSHDRAVRIDKNDDIIIASVQTLNRNSDYLRDNYLKHNPNVFLVIDEAHHATARTYRNLINKIETTSQNFNILGLTATPFRTAEKEKSYLAKIFDPKPIFSKDMQDLIINKILAEPNFVPVETNISFNKKDFTEDEIKLLQTNFDLPEKIKQKIVARKDRDRLIVEHYIKNKDKYKQTIVFALDQPHAIQLNALFNNNGIKSDFVISGTQNFIGVNKGKEDNKIAINNFRNEQIDTLVNVNILTEGTDLPKTQTVFLTRPTKSKTLMTQMVGRALRGEKAGGTKEAYIVSFIDNWGNLVAWQSPSELFVDENDILDTSKDYKKYKIQFISIELINQFVSLADKAVDTESYEAYPAIMRIPFGWYSFELEKRINKDEIDFVSCKVLVFEQHKHAFDDLESNIEILYKRFDYDNNGILNEHELEDLLSEITERFFDALEYPEPKIQDNDLRNIIHFYDANKKMPIFFTFEERDRYDITKIANHIIANDLTSKQRKEFISQEWEGNEGKSIWKDFYGNNRKFFIDDINREMHKVEFPEDFKLSEAPKIEFKKENIDNLPLHFWPSELYQEIREKVFEKWNYEHPNEKIEKKDRWKYQIDHIIPMAKGGKSVLGNLQPLISYKNKIKGDKVE